MSFYCIAIIPELLSVHFFKPRLNKMLNQNMYLLLSLTTSSPLWCRLVCHQIWWIRTTTFAELRFCEATSYSLVKFDFCFQRC